MTGGLPRVTELFEARNPSNPAIVSEIDGVVTFGNIKRGNREIIVEAKDGVVKKYLVPLTRQILAQDGDFVKAGAPLIRRANCSCGHSSIKGPFAVQEYVVNEIQEVYRLQGVKINDKHIEVIVRQMMRKVTLIMQATVNSLKAIQKTGMILIQRMTGYLIKKVVTECQATAQKCGLVKLLRCVK